MSRHRSPDPAPRRWQPYVIAGGCVLLTAASLLALYVGDNIGVQVEQDAAPSASSRTVATRTPTGTPTPAPIFDTIPLDQPQPWDESDGPLFTPAPELLAEDREPETACSRCGERTTMPTNRPEPVQEPRTAPRSTTDTPAPVVTSPEPVQPVEPESAPEPTPRPQPTLTDGLLELVNNARRDAGCQPLTEDGGLNDYARTWSAEQAEDGRMSHSDGPYAENVAVGYETAADVFDGWMSSPGHKANVLTCQWTRHGIGAAVGDDGRTYWTQVFGT